MGTAVADLGSGKLAELAALTGGTGVVGTMAPPQKAKARERFEGTAAPPPMSPFWRTMSDCGLRK